MSDQGLPEPPAACFTSDPVPSLHKGAWFGHNGRLCYPGGLRGSGNGDSRHHRRGRRHVLRHSPGTSPSAAATAAR